VHNYQLLEHKVVAVTSTQVERNIVIVDPSQIANPRHKVGILLEIIDYGSNKWYNYRLLIILVLDDNVYTLTEHYNYIGENQQFYFTLMDDVAPQLESIIVNTMSDI